MPREPPVTKTFTRTARGSGWSAGADDGISSQPRRRRATRAALRRPSTTRGRAGRAAPSAPRRSGAPRGPSGRPGDELLDARADLVGEVRRRRPDEGVDVVAGRLGHARASVPARVERCGESERRRPDAARHRPPLGAQHHGHEVRARRTASSRSPTRRSATSPRRPLFWGFTYARERSFAIALSRRRSSSSSPASLIFLNQICFVYGLHTSSASTVALILGTTPIFIGDLRDALRLRAARPPRSGPRRSCSFVGVGFVAAGQRRHLGQDRRRPARALHGGDLGGLLGRDRAADAALLAVSDQRGRAGDRLGAARGSSAPPRLADQGFQLRLGDLARLRASRSSGRSS